jgi:hypothetical protein
VAATFTLLLWSVIAAWGFVTVAFVVLMVASAIGDACERRHMRARELAQQADEWSLESEFRRQLAAFSRVPDDWP